jgi:transposase
MIQWGIIGFFVGIHFLIGFLRGTSKSTYFTIVSLIMTVVTLWIVSSLSFNMVLSTGLISGSLIETVNGFLGGAIPADIVNYLNEPEILGLVIAIADLVLRIAAYFILYPIIKFSLTITIFKPIWKHGIKKSILKKQNEEARIKHEEQENQNRKFVPSKRLNKNILSRLFGGAIGSFRGLVVAFIFLVPLLVLAGFASEVTSGLNIDQSQDGQNLSASTDLAIPIPSEIEDILRNINEMNEGGLSAIVKDITIQNKSLDRYIFDEVFTTDIIVEETSTSINFGNELEQIMGIATIIAEGGYLEDDFQVEDISHEDIANAELIFNHIGQSELIQYMIPAAVRYGVENLAPDQLDGLDLGGRDATQVALEFFYTIAWDEEFSEVFDIADSALTFASVGEWMTYMEQPELLAELTPEQGVMLANIFRSLGDLKMLSLINVAIDYATTLEEAQQQITWMDPTEVEGYLQEKFAFILDDPDFFVGSEGELYRIAQIIETVFSDEFGETNLTTLFSSVSDLETFVNTQNPEWVGAIIEDLVEVKLIIESMPVVVDFALYQQLRDSIDEELAEQIILELENIEWDQEIINVGDIYKEALKIGVGAVFGQDTNMLAFIDDVAVNHMDSLRQIVEYVFEGSEVVNAALSIASPTLIEGLVEDPALQDAIGDILVSDPDGETIDFNFGQEINNLLTIVESINEFSSLAEIQSLSGMETNEMLEVISQFSSLSETEYETLRTAVNDLQILSRAGEPALTYLQSMVTSPLIYIPDSIELNQEVTSVLDLAYTVSDYLSSQSGLYLYYQDINLEGLLADPDFRAFFTYSVEETHSDLLLINVANNIRNIVETGALSAYTTIPTTLVDEDIDSVLWKQEATEVMEAVFDLIIAAGASEGFELSYAGIITAANDTSQLPLDALYQMSENGTFLELFDSDVIHKLVSDFLSNIETQQVLVDGVNSAQTIFVAPDDFFAADPDLMDGDLIKPVEFENIVIAAYALGITSTESVSTLGLETFTGLLDRNIDPDTGEDDFDRVFGANYIYTILDKVLKLETLGDYVGSTLGSALGLTVESFDTTPSEAMLASDPLVYEDIEIGRVPKDEFRRMLTSLTLLGDFGAIGLDTFTGMIDTSQPSDDFDTFISSDYIYTILARLFDNEAFGDYVGDTLAGAFADDPIVLEMAVPSDAQGTTGVEEDLITREEIKKMMISLDMLDFGGDTEISVTTIMDMIGYNVDSETGEDDFSRFIDSLYIQDKVSQLLLSDQIIETIANGRFLATDFVMPATSIVNVDGRDRMIKQEIYDLFAGIKLIGIADFENDPVTLDSITSLTDQEEDDLLSSSYLYVTLDLMLKSETSINVPDDALEVAGDYTGMIKKTEIKDLLAVFDILGESDPEQIDVNLVTIADIQAMIDLESNIIDQLVSDAIVENLTSIPLTAYNSEGTRLTRDEMNKMIDTLLILSDDDDQQTLTSLMPIDTDTITTEKLTSIHNLDSRIIDRLTSEAIIDSGISIHSLAYDENSELDPIDSHKLDIKRSELGDMLAALDILDIDISNAGAIDQSNYTPANIGLLLDLESLIIYRLISESVMDQNLQTDESLAVDGVDDNYDPEAPGSDLKVEEMEALVEAMTVLGIVNLSQTIDVNSVSITQLRETHYLGLGTDPDVDVYESRIIHRLISDSVDDNITVPDDAYMTVDKLDLQADEISALIDALDVMGLTTLADPINVDTLTTAQLKDIHYLGKGTNPDPEDELYDSLTIHRLISDAVIDSLYSGDPLQAPDDAFEVGSTEDLEADEISALIESLDVMGLATLGDPINVDDLTVVQLRNIHYLGLGTDPGIDTYESVIIHRLISDAVVDSLYTGDPLQAPDGAFMTGSTEDLEADEISALIESLDEMGLTKLSDPINVDDLTVAQLKNIHYLGLEEDPVVDLYDSVIIHRLISDAVIDTLYTGDPLRAPDDAFMTGSTEDLKAAEISALIESLDEMGLTKLSDPINVDDLTVAQLRNIHYLGLEEDPVDDLYDSVIIHRLISESVISTVTIPDDAYMTVEQLDVEPLEVSALIEALEEMGLTKLSDPITVDTLTLTQLENIHYLGLAIDPILDEYQSLIIHRLISDAVVDSLYSGDPLQAPDGAFKLGSTEDLEEDEISALIDALDEMGLSTLGDPINVDDLSLTQLRNIHYLGLEEDPVDDLYDSVIIHRLISDSVISTVTVPDDAYMTVANEDVKVDEVSALIEALDVMGLTKLSDPIDVNGLTVATLKEIHYLGLADDPVDDQYESLIIHRLVSDAVVDSLYAGVPTNAPDGVFKTVANEDLEEDEISALIEAMEEMGISSLGASLAITNPTRTQLQNLHYLGLAEDPVTDVYDSLIVHRLISDSITSALTVPDEAYMTVANEDVKVDEISALIDAMEEMGITTLSAGLSVTNPSRTQLQNLHYLGLAEDPVTDLYDSYIVHRLISDSIDAALTVPSDAYDSVAQDDIKVDEISALIEAMEEMNITTLSSGLTFGNPTTAQIQALNYLGLGVDPVTDLYDSYIVHRLLSDAIDSVISVPVDSFIVGRPNDIKPDEINHLVGTMNIIGATDVTDFSGITVADLSGLTAGEIEYITEETTDGPNLIVYYFISDIVDPDNDNYPTDDAYVMDGPTRVRLKRAYLADALEIL